MQRSATSFIAAILGAVAVSCLAQPSQAADYVNNLGTLTQPDFRLFSEDLGSALSYKPLTPATPLGLTGFDIGAEVTDTQISNSSVWHLVTGNGSSTSLVVPKIQVYKGLPLGFDVGAFYSKVPNSNIRLWGADMSYALLHGGITAPAVGLRASYTRLQGVDQLDFHTTGVDLSVSKGFLMFTPYAGVGQVWVNSTPSGIPGLQGESFSLTKYYVGADINFAVINMDIEADRTGSDNTYGIKLGWRF